MRRIAPALALLGALAILASACASNKATGLPTEPTEAPTTAACPAEIEMTEATLKFVPETCTTTVGTTLTWTNGSVAHTVTSEPESPVKFDSGTIEGGGEYSFTFETAGTIPYYCKLHTSASLRDPRAMIGTITVEAA